MKPTPTRRTDPDCRYGTEPTCVTDCIGPADQAVVYLGRITGRVLTRRRACRAHIYEMLVRARWSGTKAYTRIDPHPTTTGEPDGSEHHPRSGTQSLASSQGTARPEHAQRTNR